MYINFIYLPTPARSPIKTIVFSVSIPPTPNMPISWNEAQLIPCFTQDKQNHFIILIIIAVLYSQNQKKFQDCLVHLPVLRRDSKIDICLNYPYTKTIPPHPPSQKIILLFTHSKCNFTSWKWNCFFPPILARLSYWSQAS